MPQPNDLSRSLVALDQNSTIIAVVEMSQSSWLVGGMNPSSSSGESVANSKSRGSSQRFLRVYRLVGVCWSPASHFFEFTGIRHSNHPR